MRNPFKRQPRPATKPSLRERMAITREKFGRVGKAAALARLALGPPPAPEPAPPVDRAALVNYATFLAWERNRVCAELYPHLGTKAVGFVLGMNAAERFFYGSPESRSDRPGLPPAATRAVAVLDLVGVDWRSDRPGDGIERSIGLGVAEDTGERPAAPYGWPTIDAALTSALAELRMIDAAMAALMEGHGRDAEDTPGWNDLNDAREAAIDALELERAQGTIGLQAKAMALQVRTVAEADGETARIARSLAGDLLAIDGRAVEPRSDPIFAAIKECERLEAVCTAKYAKGNDGNSTSEQSDAASAVWGYVTGPLSETVPTTAAGCVALARFIPPLFDRWGASLDGDQAGKLFRLIERSPAL